eukprot:TRINITY_DN31653_c0_g1_i1.p1 TRINITY_DN31653_c0_g1~~TRINITY_DN31653_c0_g1_i1.p1  ORF type:complete len:1525 (+),score=627.74 TRINITY_DN31653_c0_g1_i1:103-4677(+)
MIPRGVLVGSALAAVSLGVRLDDDLVDSAEAEAAWHQTGAALSEREAAAATAAAKPQSPAGATAADAAEAASKGVEATGSAASSSSSAPTKDTIDLESAATSVPPTIQAHSGLPMPQLAQALLPPQEAAAQAQAAAPSSGGVQLPLVSQGPKPSTSPSEDTLPAVGGATAPQPTLPPALQPAIKIAAPPVFEMATAPRPEVPITSLPVEEGRPLPTPAAPVKVSQPLPEFPVKAAPVLEAIAPALTIAQDPSAVASLPALAGASSATTLRDKLAPPPVSPLEEAAKLKLPTMSPAYGEPKPLPIITDLGAIKRFDCSSGFSNWEAGWSLEKKAYCCATENKGCPGNEALHFDCKAGLQNWQDGWSEYKKDWCCRHENVGCSPAGRAEFAAKAALGASARAAERAFSEEEEAVEKRLEREALRVLNKAKTDANHDMRDLANAALTEEKTRLMAMANHTTAEDADLATKRADAKSRLLKALDSAEKEAEQHKRRASAQNAAAKKEIEKVAEEEKTHIQNAVEFREQQAVAKAAQEMAKGFKEMDSQKKKVEDVKQSALVKIAAKNMQAKEKANGQETDAKASATLEGKDKLNSLLKAEADARAAGDKKLQAKLNEVQTIKGKKVQDIHREQEQADEKLSSMAGKVARQAEDQAEVKGRKQGDEAGTKIGSLEEAKASVQQSTAANRKKILAAEEREKSDRLHEVEDERKSAESKVAAKADALRKEAEAYESAEKAKVEQLANEKRNAVEKEEDAKELLAQGALNKQEANAEKRLSSAEKKIMDGLEADLQEDNKQVVATVKQAQDQTRVVEKQVTDQEEAKIEAIEKAADAVIKANAATLTRENAAMEKLAGKEEAAILGEQLNKEAAAAKAAVAASKKADVEEAVETRQINQQTDSAKDNIEKTMDAERVSAEVAQVKKLAAEAGAIQKKAQEVDGVRRVAEIKADAQENEAIAKAALTEQEARQKASEAALQTLDDIDKFKDQRANGQAVTHAKDRIKAVVDLNEGVAEIQKHYQQTQERVMTDVLSASKLSTGDREIKEGKLRAKLEQELDETEATRRDAAKKDFAEEVGKKEKALKDQLKGSLDAMKKQVDAAKEAERKALKEVADMKLKLAQELTLAKEKDEAASAVSDAAALPGAISTTLTAPAKKGSTKLEVASSAGFSVGDRITIGDEANAIAGLGSIILQTPLQKDHPVGTTIFVLKAPAKTPAAAASPSFDCHAGSELAALGWSDEKIEWCCAHENIGCDVQPYDCHDISEVEMGWSAHKKAWCCKRHNVGCTAGSSGGKAQTSTPAPSEAGLAADVIGSVTLPPGVLGSNGDVLIPGFKADSSLLPVGSRAAAVSAAIHEVEADGSAQHTGSKDSATTAAAASTTALPFQAELKKELSQAVSSPGASTTAMAALKDPQSQAAAPSEAPATPASAAAPAAEGGAAKAALKETHSQAASAPPAAPAPTAPTDAPGSAPRQDKAGSAVPPPFFVTEAANQAPGLGEAGKAASSEASEATKKVTSLLKSSLQQLFPEVR